MADQKTTTPTAEASGVPADPSAMNIQQAAKTPEEHRLMVRRLIETAVNRLTAVVNEESEALRHNSPIDLKASNDRKSLGLVELNRALRVLDGARPDGQTQKLLEELNGKLDANRHVLKLHMEAVREVAALISQTMREADSDGTYTVSFRSKGQTP